MYTHFIFYTLVCVGDLSPENLASFEKYTKANVFVVTERKLNRVDLKFLPNTIVLAYSRFGTRHSGGFKLMLVFFFFVCFYLHIKSCRYKQITITI